MNHTKPSTNRPESHTRPEEENTRTRIPNDGGIRSAQKLHEDQPDKFPLFSSAPREEPPDDILATAPRGKDKHPLAPNGQRSNLTEDQWAAARTDAFKRDSGDWLAASHRAFLDGEPVIAITGEEFQKQEGESLYDRVSEWFSKQHDGVANNPEIGPVILDREGVQSSWGHGHGRFKAAAFAAVPAVINKGRVIERANNWKGRNHDTAVISAPIRIGNDERVMVVVVEMREKNHFYLHEAYLKENLQNGLSFKSGALRESGARSGDIEKIIREIYAVNPEDFKGRVDSNGEPLPAEVGRRQDRHCD